MAQTTHTDSAHDALSVAPPWAAEDSAWAETWLSHLAHTRRLSGHTLAAYRRDLAAFGEWARTQHINRFENFDTQHIRSYAAASHRSGLDPRSIQRRLSSLRTFFQYLLSEGHLKRNPVVGVAAPKAARRLPDVIDVDRMSRL
jgi:integrase/recombinase XerC